MKYRARRRGEPDRTEGATLGQDEPSRAPAAADLESALAMPALAEQPIAFAQGDLPGAPPDPEAAALEVPPSLHSRFEAFEFRAA